MMRNSSSGSSLNSSDGPAAAASDTTTVLKKGPWTAAEDAILIDYVQKHGEGNWNAVQKNCGLARCGKSCRLRWANHLRPNLKKGSFTHEEEMLILQLHAQLGNKWARMAAQLPGRTDNEIKNFWNTRIKRRQRAGLPVYPSEHQIQQQRMRMRPSPSTSPLQSPLPPFKQSPMHSPAMPVMFMPDAPRLNRIGGEGPSTFQFPVADQIVSGPATMSNIFQYNYGIYGEINVNVNNSPAMPMMYSAAPVKTELPSSQLFNSGGGGGGESGCGLLDAMLQEAEVVQRKMVMNNDPIGAVKDFGGDGDGGGSNGEDVKDSFPKLEESSRCSNGINVKTERPEEMNSMSTTHDDISKLFDMISTPGMPAAPEWYHATTDSCDISNGGQSSVVTDDELGLELQHLTSSLAPEADQDWNIGSCPWNNMPGIC